MEISEEILINYQAGSSKPCQPRRILITLFLDGTLWESSREGKSGKTNSTVLQPNPNLCKKKHWSVGAEASHSQPEWQN
jgi:hypothetical protein